MDNVQIEETDNSPGVVFDYAANTFLLRGMSFMEDSTGFYGPLMAQFRPYMEGLSGATVQFDFALHYFNSSSARLVLSLFDLLDAVAERDNTVTGRWHHDGDEDMIEQGEEFGEDLVHATFELVEDLD